MSTKRLQSFKSITLWCGALVTFCGIVLNVESGGSLWSGALALFGLFLTCCSHWITNTLAKRQADEKAAGDERFRDLQRQSEQIEERLNHTIRMQGSIVMANDSK